MIKSNMKRQVFFILAKFWMVFFVLFLGKYLIQFLYCMLYYLLMEENVQTAVHWCSFKTGVCKSFGIFTGSFKPVHYTFPNIYLMVDNWYFRVMFYYCKIRPRNRKNFGIYCSKFLVKRWFFVKQDFNYPSRIFFLFLVFNHFPFREICKGLY